MTPVNPSAGSPLVDDPAAVPYEGPRQWCPACGACLKTVLHPACAGKPLDVEHPVAVALAELRDALQIDGTAAELRRAFLGDWPTIRRVLADAAPAVMARLAEMAGAG